MKAIFLLCALGAVLVAADAVAPSRPNPLRNAYFGDLHVHTSYSLDAYIMGNRNDPRAAYRFGRGEPITIAGNITRQLGVPLDFMAVTDHNIWLGELAICTDPKEPAYPSDVCKSVREAGSAPASAQKVLFSLVPSSLKSPPERSPGICGGTEPASGPCYERSKTVWKELQSIAQQYYNPGKFTTFIGFEWRANMKRIGMLHRNVIFRGPTVPDVVASAIELNNRPERLWEWLQKSCTGDCRALAIPHNTNFGWGVALDAKNSDGTPFTKEILQRRAKTEPLIEIFQQKGNSECAPGLGTTDEQCAFEQVFEACKNAETTFCAVARDYVRNALKTGLTLQDQFGVNPFQYGFIGSTDTHLSNGGGTIEKESPQYGNPIDENAPPNPNFPVGAGAFNPGGLAGVWAEENTRESIFDALKRRETFATSGTRTRVRFFAGWDYPQDLDKKRNLLQLAYKGGVPMGGQLHASGQEKAPKLVAWAIKDPADVNLQRIQIVKGWTKGGVTFEKVFDVACSDGLRPDRKTWKCPDNGATVNLNDCSGISGGAGAEALNLPRLLEDSCVGRSTSRDRVHNSLRVSNARRRNCPGNARLHRARQEDGLSRRYWREEDRDPGTAVDVAGCAGAHSFARRFDNVANSPPLGAGIRGRERRAA